MALPLPLSPAPPPPLLLPLLSSSPIPDHRTVLEGVEEEAKEGVACAGGMAVGGL